MLTIIFSALGVGLIVGIMVGCEECSAWRGFGGFLFGAVIGIVCSVMVLLCISCHTADYDDCETKTSTYDLMPYVIESDDYYAYTSNSDNGMSTSVQYLDENGTPQSLNLRSHTEYDFGVAKKPSIEITSYTTEGNLWCFAPNAPVPQYKIYLPDKSLIYQGIN